MGRVSKEDAAMKAYHDVKNLRFNGECMILVIDGEERSFKVKDVSDTLDRASDKERATFEISPSGYGIHWPLIDEDIAIDGLLGVVHARDSRRKIA
jgi:hypothetical protein